MGKSIIRRSRGRFESVYYAGKRSIGSESYIKYRLRNDGAVFPCHGRTPTDVIHIGRLELVPILPKHTEELERFVARARMLDRNFKFRVADEDTCRKERMLYKEWLRKSAAKNTIRVK